jgi:Leucine-rich repeat (LRR) protein
MKRTRAEVTELQISNFIKEPENLKLLILAGTQLQETEFRTIRLCINLIKLDLSSNNLRTIPPCLTELTALKILFLHNNLIEGT